MPPRLKLRRVGLCLSFLLLFLTVVILHQVFPPKSLPDPSSFIINQSAVLHNYFNASCPLGKACIGFGTPLFGSWDTWAKWFGSKDILLNLSFMNCAIVAKPENADALLFNGHDLYWLYMSNSFIHRQRKLYPYQRWVYFSWESPPNVYNESKYTQWRYMFNWTATYERTADIYTPYGDIKEHRSSTTDPPRPLAARKYLAFAVVSNCNTSVNRLQYLQQLQHHMELHIFGRCGKPFPYASFSDAARNYYFFLAMENSRCKDYVTEKFWGNGLASGVVPVVFGAPVEDYLEVAPPLSFVAGEVFSSPRHLATYLIRLAANPKLYETFFLWKRTFRLRQTDKAEDLLGKLCLMLNADLPDQTKDMLQEWRKPRCRPEPWIK